MDQIQNQLLLVLLVVGLLLLGTGYLTGKIAGKQLVFTMASIVLLCLAGGYFLLLTGLYARS